MPIKVKICGINSRAAMEAAINHRAAYIGLVFYPKSPRSLDIMAAAALSSIIPRHINIVGLFVNPDDDLISNVLEAIPLDMIQLHGDETAKRCMQIKTRTDRKIIKAIGIEQKSDLLQISPYEEICDMLLFDAKPPQNAKLPGGNAIAFDWQILNDQQYSKPWMLAGGLNIDNIENAIKITNAKNIDISSGVEISAGQKSPKKITSFLDKVRQI